MWYTIGHGIPQNLGTTKPSEASVLIEQATALYVDQRLVGALRKLAAESKLTSTYRLTST